MAAYNSSKGAVHQMARNLASEWGKEYGIRVNTLSPGYIMTDMVQQMFRKVPERKDLWSHQNMLGRLSTPEEYRYELAAVRIRVYGGYRWLMVRIIGVPRCF
jgi:NAD(P)-dependent dehydrogenase (short-subunit alcohol dehydrogenase family)